MSHPATDPVNPGDIVSFRFPYSEGMAPYARPCVVLDATEDERCCHVNSPTFQVGMPIVVQGAVAADFHASKASSRW